LFLLVHFRCRLRFNNDRPLVAVSRKQKIEDRIVAAVCLGMPAELAACLGDQALDPCV
jgi:hypothetical protein